MNEVMQGHNDYPLEATQQFSVEIGLHQKVPHPETICRNLMICN